MFAGVSGFKCICGDDYGHDRVASIKDGNKEYKCPGNPMNTCGGPSIYCIRGTNCEYLHTYLFVLLNTECTILIAHYI